MMSAVDGAMQRISALLSDPVRRTTRLWTGPRPRALPPSAVSTFDHGDDRRPGVSCARAIRAVSLTIVGGMDSRHGHAVECPASLILELKTAQRGIQIRMNWNTSATAVLGLLDRAIRLPTQRRQLHRPPWYFKLTVSNAVSHYSAL